MASKKFTDEFWKQYDEYLRSPHWTRKREAVFAWKGRVCTAQLDGCIVHASECHHTKDGYRCAFDTPLFELEPVCRSCHRKITAAHRTAKWKRSDLTEVWHRRISGEQQTR